MKILGIDDSLDMNQLMDDVFTSEGHNFIYTDNGIDGLRLIQEQQFDVVFLDIAMPKFSGYDVIDVLVKDGIIKKQPVILLTASTIGDTEVEELIKKGVHSCLRKPIKIDTLLDIVKNLKD